MNSPQKSLHYFVLVYFLYILARSAKISLQRRCGTDNDHENQLRCDWITQYIVFRESVILPNSNQNAKIIYRQQTIQPQINTDLSEDEPVGVCILPKQILELFAIQKTDNTMKMFDNERKIKVHERSIVFVCHHGVA